MNFETLESRAHLSAVTISVGGTYSGTFDDGIIIATTAPVTIENATVRNDGHLIEGKSGVAINLTLRDVEGYGRNPNKDGKYPGRFAWAPAFKSIDIEGCYLEGTSGIKLEKAATGGTFRIVGNQARNIDGRISAGTNKWRTPGNGGSDDKSFYRVQFFQVTDCQKLGACEIAFNRVTNEPGKSRVEDNISVHRSRPQSSSTPILVHDNLIDGAYAVNWQTAKFSGGGIIVDGGWTDSRGEAAYVRIYNNTVLNTSNYGIAIAAGHDSQIYNNRVFSTGKVGSVAVRAANVGLYIQDRAGVGSKHFYGNYAQDNHVGWHRRDGARNDWYMPDDVGSKFTGNTKHSGTVTDAVLEAERERWLTSA